MDAIEKLKEPTMLDSMAHWGHDCVHAVALRMPRIAIAAVATLSLAACVQPPKTMYNWQSYQPTVYTYLKEDSTDYAVQAAALEKNIQTARSADQPLPPGFHAHLGMLYLKTGEGTKAVEQMQAEKAAFPESTAFMDFLLRNVPGTSGDAPKPDTTAGTIPATTTTTTTKTSTPSTTPVPVEKPASGAVQNDKKGA
jgi:hypothetical protein